MTVYFNVGVGDIWDGVIAFTGETLTGVGVLLIGVGVGLTDGSEEGVSMDSTLSVGITTR